MDDVVLEHFRRVPTSMLLDHLRSIVEAEGVDGDPALVQAARRRGLAVVEGDVLEVLRGRADASAGAIT